MRPSIVPSTADATASSSRRSARAARLAAACGDRWVGVAHGRCSSSTTSPRAACSRARRRATAGSAFSTCAPSSASRTLDMQRAVPEYLPFFGVSGPAHHMPNRCPFGPVFVWMPFYLVGCALQGLARAASSLVPAGHGAVAVRSVDRRRSARSPACSSAGATPTCWSSATRGRDGGARRLDRGGVGHADRLVRRDAAVLSARAGLPASSPSSSSAGSATLRRRRRGGACCCSVSSAASA